MVSKTARLASASPEARDQAVRHNAVRTRFRGCLLALVVVSVAGWAHSAAAQTVQLPTFSFFNYRGAVMVPDGGSIMAGGVRSSSEGRTSRGVPLLGGIPGANRPFRNEGIGRETGGSSMTIKPTILIMSELEEDHLAAAGYDREGNRLGGADAVLAKAAFLTRHMGRNAQADPSGSRQWAPRR